MNARLQQYFEFAANVWLEFAPGDLKDKFPRDFRFPVTIPYLFEGELPKELTGVPRLEVSVESFSRSEAGAANTGLTWAIPRPMDVTTKNAIARPWKAILMRSISWGAGFGVAIALVVGALVYISDRPKPWETKTLVFKEAGLKQFGVAADGSSKWIWLVADIQNRSNEDITLPKDTRIMEAKGGNGVLDASSFKLTKDYFLPAHETAAITLEDDLYCESGKTTNQCYQRSFSEVEQIVLFDDAHKYEVRIELPKHVEEEF